MVPVLLRRRAGGGIPLNPANVTRVSSACIAVRRTNEEVRAFASTSAVTILMWLSSGILSSLGQNQNQLQVGVHDKHPGSDSGWHSRQPAHPCRRPLCENQVSKCRRSRGLFAGTGGNILGWAAPPPHSSFTSTSATSSSVSLVCLSLSLSSMTGFSGKFFCPLETLYK